jgi:hypothetical protein
LNFLNLNLEVGKDFKPRIKSFVDSSGKSRVKYGTLNSTHDPSSMSLLNDSESMFSNRHPSLGNMKIEIQDRNIRELDPRLSMRQPKYFRNVDAGKSKILHFE